MASFAISDLCQEVDFFEELTPEELQKTVLGGAAAAGSVTAARYSKIGGKTQATAASASAAISSNEPNSKPRVELDYSFRPQLSVSAEAFYL